MAHLILLSSKRLIGYLCKFHIPYQVLYSNYELFYFLKPLSVLSISVFSFFPKE